MHTYSGSQLDRAAIRRLDPDWLEERWEREDTHFIQFAGERPFVRIDADAGTLDVQWPERLDRDVGLDQAVFLGIDRQDRALFGLAARIDGEGAPLCGLADDTKLIDLRSLAAQGILSNHELSLLAQARSMLVWHETHGFCARCGAPSTISEGGYKRQCGACGREHFPRTDPVVIMVVRDGENCLLGRSPHFAEGSYSALAGFVEPGETIEEAAKREVFEEAGIEVGAVHYHSSQPWPFPSSLMIGLVGDATSRTLDIDWNELAGCALVPARGSGDDAQGRAPGGPLHASALRHRPPPGAGLCRGRHLSAVSRPRR